MCEVIIVDPKYAFIPCLMQICLLVSFLLKMFNVPTKKDNDYYQKCAEISRVCPLYCVQLPGLYINPANYRLLFPMRIGNIIMYGE